MTPSIQFEDKVIALFRKNWKSIAFFLMTGVAVAIRLAGFSFTSGDFRHCLNPWTYNLKMGGHFFGIAELSTDYGAPYLYILSAISYLPVTWFLFAIKAVSCIFDFICAIYAMKIIVKLTGNQNLDILVYSVVLLWPTMVLNGSVWAQCDAMYAGLILMMLWYFMEETPKLAMVLFGLAFSLKLQAVFVLPFIIILFIYRKWHLPHALYAVASFVGINVPSWFLGLPITHFIKVYVAQTSEYSYAVTLNAPTIYAFLPNTIDYYEVLEQVGTTIARLGIAAVVILCIALALYVLKANRKLSSKTYILLFLAATLIIPYCLPYMHERYFFMADVAVLLYAFIEPKRWWIAPMVTFPSCITYATFLFIGDAYGVENATFGLHILALVMGVAVIFVVKWLLESIQNDPKNDDEPNATPIAEKTLV